MLPFDINRIDDAVRVALACADHGIIHPDGFIEAAINDIHRLFFMYRHAKKHSGHRVQPDYEAFLTERLIQRINHLQNFYHTVQNVLTPFYRGVRFDVRFLNGDSHHGAMRPLLFEDGHQKKVLKFTDPRSTQLYFSVLNQILARLGVDYPAPRLTCDEHHRWQIMDYLQAPNSAAYGEDISLYGYVLGVHLALSSVLRITDLHFENVLVSGAFPHVIDTECMLYDFLAEDVKEDFHLLNTGLLAASSAVSGIMAGEQSVTNLDMRVGASGDALYSQRQEHFGNRIYSTGGCPVPIGTYAHELRRGFCESYANLCAMKRELHGALHETFSQGLRTRFLVRTTAHYRTTVDMLYSPSSVDHARHGANVKRIFRGSGAMIEGLPEAVVEREWSDIQQGDIPYFWIAADGGELYHRDECVMQSSSFRSIDERISRALHRLDAANLDQLLAVITTQLRSSLEGVQ